MHGSRNKFLTQVSHRERVIVSFIVLRDKLSLPKADAISHQIQLNLITVIIDRAGHFFQLLIPVSWYMMTILPLVKSTL